MNQFDPQIKGFPQIFSGYTEFKISTNTFRAIHDFGSKGSIK